MEPLDDDELNEDRVYRVPYSNAWDAPSEWSGDDEDGCDDTPNPPCGSGGSSALVVDVKELDDCDVWPGDLVRVRGAGSDVRYRVEQVRNHEVRAWRVSTDNHNGAVAVLGVDTLEVLERPRGARYLKTPLGWSLLKGGFS